MDLEDISAEVVTGGVEVLALAAHDRGVDIGDDEALVAGDRRREPRTIRCRDGRSSRSGKSIGIESAASNTPVYST